MTSHRPVREPRPGAGGQHGGDLVEQTKVGVRQNTTMEQLTILATVFLPLTFIIGLFGQNFAWLVRHISGYTAFIVYGLGGLVVPLALLFIWLRLRALRTSTGTMLHDT